MSLPNVPPDLLTRRAANVDHVTSTVHVASFDDLDTRTLYAILKLRSDVFIVEQNCAYPDLDDRDLEPDTKHIWLAADGSVLAYLRILEGEPVRIGRVVVAPQARRRGYAQALLAKALDVIGPREATLNAQSYATKLYESAGFTVVGAEFDEDGIPHVPMKRLISGQR